MPAILPYPTGRTRASHALGGAHSEEIETVAEHLTGGVVQPQTRTVHGLDRIVTLRDHTAVVVPAVVEPCELLEVAGDAVRLTDLGGECDDAGNSCSAPSRAASDSCVSVSGANSERSTPESAAFRATLCVRAWAYCT